MFDFLTKRFPIWGVILVSLLAVLLIFAWFGVQFTGWAIPLAILAVTGAILWAFILWTFDRRPPGWQKACSAEWHIYPDDKPWDYMTFRYSLIQHFCIVMAALAAALVLLVGLRLL